MSELFDQTVAKVKQLSAEEQEQAAYALIDYLDSRERPRLTEEQVAEVGRRRMDPHAELVSHEEARAFIQRLVAR